MIPMLFMLFCFAALVIASLSDIKTREVPDWLSFALIFTGFGFRLLYSIITNDYTYLLDGLIGFLVLFVIALLMFYSGQWGGGDSKMIMGIGALIGLRLNYDDFLISFLINTLIIGGLYGLCWSVALVIRDWKRFRKVFVKIGQGRSYKIAKYIILIVSIVLIICAILISEWFVRIGLLGIAFLLVVMIYLIIFTKAVEDCCLIKNAKVEELTEGDWIVKDIKIKGDYICGPKDLGISKQQIRKLKKNKIKNVLIKNGIPFIPSFLIGFIITYFLGNVILLFV